LIEQTARSFAEFFNHSANLPANSILKGLGMEWYYKPTPFPWAGNIKKWLDGNCGLSVPTKRHKAFNFSGGHGNCMSL